MKIETFEAFWKENKQDLIETLKSYQNDIDDDYRAYEDDTEPGIQITISVNEDCDSWSIQSGDNSYTGNCYGDPYWGVSAVYRDSNIEELADYLIDDLASVIEFEN